MVQIITLFVFLAAFSFCNIKYPWIGDAESLRASNLNSQCRGYCLDIQSTNCIKGIAILFILVGHIAGTFHTVVFTPLPALGVSLFLMCSGYGLSQSYKSKGLNNFWGKKISRVLLPYAIVITLLVIFRRYDIDLIHYILEITGLKTMYWYVAYQIKWYLVFFFSMLFFHRHCVLIFALVGVLMFLTLDFLEIEQTPAFLIGVFASKYKDRLTKFSRRSMLIQLAVFTFIGVFFLGLKQLPAIREYFGTLLYSIIQMMHNMAFALCIVGIVSILPFIRKNVFLIFCGIISYEIYLVHFPIYPYVGGDFMLAIALISISIITAALFYAVNGKISTKLGYYLHF